MPKVVKKTVKKIAAEIGRVAKHVKKAVKPRVIEVGSRVVVTTVYTVKRMPAQGAENQPYVNEADYAAKMLVAVEDECHDRVLNFRLGELRLEE